MTDAELREIEERANAAAPGPWKWSASWMSGPGQHLICDKCGGHGRIESSCPCSKPSGMVRCDKCLGTGYFKSDIEIILYPRNSSEGDGREWVRLSGACGHYIEHGDNAKNTLAFIARAREDVPKLIAEIRRLKEKGGK